MTGTLIVNSAFDHVIVGGGVIGLTTALLLAEQGARVGVIDRQSCGREASWAGAGMLPPAGVVCCDGDPEVRLRSYSHSMWQKLSADLKERTGIDNGYHVCGAFEIALPETKPQLLSQIDKWVHEGIQVQPLDSLQTRQHFPELNPRHSEGYFLPDFAQVRNPRHLRALRKACLQKQVSIFEHEEVCDFETVHERLNAVLTRKYRIACGQLCVTAGAWSGALLKTVPGFRIPVVPVRGQIIQLRAALRVSHVIELGKQYIVPRQDGLFLVGATEENAGFCNSTTQEGFTGLFEFVSQLFPDHTNLEVIRTWAGLRPCSPDELPLIGRVPKFTNLFLAAGHFRSGLQMSPGTAAIVCDLMLGRQPYVSLAGLEVDRFTETTVAGL